MIRIVHTSFVLTVFCVASFAADAPTVGQTLDAQFRNADREIVGLFEAMPADKINFAPTSGEFKGVRTFAQQAKHMATYNGARDVRYLRDGKMLAGSGGGFGDRSLPSRPFSRSSPVHKASVQSERTWMSSLPALSVS